MAEVVSHGLEWDRSSENPATRRSGMIASLWNDPRPCFRRELGYGQRLRPFEFGLFQFAEPESVQAAERRDHAFDDLRARQPGLAAQRIDPLGRALRGLVRQFFAPDPQ